MKSEKNKGMKKKYAGFWIRLVAFIVDLFIAVIIGVVASIALEVLLEIAGLAEMMPVIDKYIGTIVIWAYFIYLTYNFDATLGKKLVGIEVVSAKKDKLELLQIIFRETLGKIISFLLLGAGFFVVGFSKKKHSLHDKLGSTEVVKKELDFSKKQKIAYLVAIVFTFLIVIAAAVGATTWLIKFNSAKNEARLAIAQVIVFQTAAVGNECQKQGGQVLEPTTPFGEGDICSIDLGIAWPVVSNGFSYGEIKNEKSILVSEDGETVECRFRDLNCNFE